MWPFGKAVPKTFLGIDIGTTSIKIVEITQKGKRKVLENYGELQISALYKNSFRTFEKNTLLLSTGSVARATRAMLTEAEIKTRKAIFSLPDFATFFTTFELPSMTAKEIGPAVEFEARKYVPLDPSEIILDWQLISKHNPEEGKNKVFMMAVPGVVVDQYKTMAKNSELEITALEAEVFGLKRAALAEDNKTTVGLIDMGAQSTTVSIVDGEILKASLGFDTAGKDLTFAIAKSLGIDTEAAEEVKREQGILTGNYQKDVAYLLIPIIDLILQEIKKVIRNFEQKEVKKVTDLILAGGTALLPGLLGYFQENFSQREFGKISVKIADPFAEIFYPPLLEKTIKKMGPTYAIAVGEALKGFE